MHMLLVNRSHFLLGGVTTGLWELAAVFGLPLTEDVTLFRLMGDPDF